MRQNSLTYNNISQKTLLNSSIFLIKSLKTCISSLWKKIIIKRGNDGSKNTNLTLFLGRNPSCLFFFSESTTRGLGLLNSNFSRETNDIRKIEVMLSHQWGKNESRIQHYPMSKNLTGLKMDHTTYIYIYKLDLRR